MPITALPTPPSRQDAANFNDRADAFLGALPIFQTEANALQTDVNAKQLLAAASESNAALSATAAANTAGVSIWVSGTTYAIGANRFSPINFLTYRRKTAGAGTTDPFGDPANWQLLTGQGDVTLDSIQTITGAKTFAVGPYVPTQPINTNDTTAASTAFVIAQIADDAPTKTGDGASGTWNINAATVTTITTDQVLNATAAATVGSVGSYALLSCTDNTIINPGTTKAGSLLRYRGAAATAGTSGNNFDTRSYGTAPSGTWRLMSYIEGYYEYYGNIPNHANVTALWLRIS